MGLEHFLASSGPIRCQLPIAMPNRQHHRSCCSHDSAWDPAVPCSPAASTHLADEVAAAGAPHVEGHLKADDEDAIARQLARAVTQRAVGTLGLQEAAREAEVSRSQQQGGVTTADVQARARPGANVPSCLARLPASPC